MPFHNFLADCQSDAGTGIFLPAVKPLKDDEDALGVLRGNADAVVSYGERPPIAASAGREVNAGWFIAPELDRVSDQVLEQLSELGAVGHHHRERVVGEKGSILFNGYLQIIDGLSEDRFGVGGG
jgi:hypothetical protein